jgi:hypothetical protein
MIPHATHQQRIVRTADQRVGVGQHRRRAADQGGKPRVARRRHRLRQQRAQRAMRHDGHGPSRAISGAMATPSSATESRPQIAQISQMAPVLGATFDPRLLESMTHEVETLRMGTHPLRGRDVQHKDLWPSVSSVDRLRFRQFEVSC